MSKQPSWATATRVYSSETWQDIKPRRDPRLHEIDRLIAAGWGEVAQAKIPARVWDALRAGRPIPRPHASFHLRECPCGKLFKSRAPNHKHCSQQCSMRSAEKARLARNEANRRLIESQVVREPEPDPLDLPADQELTPGQRAVLAGCYVEALGSLAKETTA